MRRMAKDAKLDRVPPSVNRQPVVAGVAGFGANDRAQLCDRSSRGNEVERPCGRGLMLMRAYMTELEFLPPGNVCRMRLVSE